LSHVFLHFQPQVHKTDVSHATTTEAIAPSRTLESSKAESPVQDISGYASVNIDTFMERTFDKPVEVGELLFDDPST
jgi:hypothetical protein